MTLTLLFGVFLLALFVGVPVVWALGIGVIAALTFGDQQLPLNFLANQLYVGADQITLAAIPMFILAGSLMNEGGLTRRIIDVAEQFVGRLRGGLAIVSVLSSMMYGAITGSATAGTGAVTTVLSPIMSQKGYPRGYTGALMASSGTLGIIIPPSVILILYGVTTSTSIGDLFLGGVLAGIVTGVALLIAAYVVAVRKKLPKSDTSPSLGAMVRSTFYALPALGMPILVIGAMLTGQATATEASFVAVVYSFIVGGLVYRQFTFRGLRSAVVESVRLTGAIMVILAVATAFAWVLTAERLPANTWSFIEGIGLPSALNLAAISVLLLFIGTWLDTAPALLVFAPIIHPVMVESGLTSVQTGVAVTMLLGIGLFTPPVGTNIFVVSTVSRTSVIAIVRALPPFWLASLIAVTAVLVFPELTNWLPGLRQ